MSGEVLPPLCRVPAAVPSPRRCAESFHEMEGGRHPASRAASEDAGVPGLLQFVVVEERRARRSRQFAALRAGSLRFGKPGIIGAAALTRISAVGPRTALSAWRSHEFQPVDEDGAYGLLWAGAGREVGAEVVRTGSFCRVSRDGVTVWTWRQETDLDGVASLRLAADKEAAHAVLAENGLPVPAHIAYSASSPGPAADFLSHWRRCVVKPASGTARGNGVTTGVSDVAGLEQATMVAGRWGDRLLIEPQLRGTVYRLLYLDAELLDVVVRRPPTVVGDGRRSVAELVAEENRRRSADERALGTAPLSLDLELALTLAAQGVSPRTVVDPGRTLVVKNVVNENAAADNERVATPRQVLVELGRAAARALGIRLAGVDVVDPDDPAEPATVLEVNGTPGLLLHERAVGAPAQTSPASVVLDRLLSDPRPGRGVENDTV